MKHIIFLFLSLLLLIILSSCKNNPSAPVNNQELISFQPVTGSTGDTIFILGKNLLKDTLLKVLIGDSVVQIIKLSNDTVEIIVPKLSDGNYKIKIKSFSKTIVFDSTIAIKAKTPIIYSIEPASFYPASGFPDDTIVIVGKNFLKDSVKKVFFGDSLSKIIKLMDDSIFVIVPNEPAGFVFIKVMSSDTTFTFTSSFEIKIKLPPALDLSKFGRFDFALINLHVNYSYYQYDYWNPDTAKPNSGESILFNYGHSYKTNNINIIGQDSFNKYSIREPNSGSEPLFSSLFYEIDLQNLILSTYHIDILQYLIFKPEYNAYQEISIKINLENIPFKIYGDSLIRVDLQGILVEKCQPQIIVFDEGKYEFGSHHQYYHNGIKSLLPSTDSTRIILNIYR